MQTHTRQKINPKHLKKKAHIAHPIFAIRLKKNRMIDTRHLFRDFSRSRAYIKPRPYFIEDLVCLYRGRQSSLPQPLFLLRRYFFPGGKIQMREEIGARVRFGENVWAGIFPFSSWVVIIGGEKCELLFSCGRCVDVRKSGDHSRLCRFLIGKVFRLLFICTNSRM